MGSPDRARFDGTVLDPSGAAIRGATVAILNPVSHYQQSVNTDAQGAFEFDNVPFNNYHMTATAAGFSERGAGRRCAVRRAGGSESQPADRRCDARR